MTPMMLFLGLIAFMGWPMFFWVNHELRTAQQKLDAAHSTGLMIAQWWLAAQDRLDEIHDNHVRAGRTPHERQREKVKDVAARLAISSPCNLRSRTAIEAEAKASLNERRERVNASLK